MKQIFGKLSTVATVIPALIIGAVMSLSVALFTTSLPAVAATSCDPSAGLTGGVGDCTSGSGTVSALTGSNGVVTTIINVMLFIIGILCVIMIIFGGIRYTTSNGEPDRVKGAKNTIVYAVVGLIVAMVSWALVNWVFTNIGK